MSIESGKEGKKLKLGLKLGKELKET